ncbi:MAG: ABC transporter permease [Chloroflexi bacterium]|nr:ABC transporter permease [Chloroflexota bacterium]
MSVIAQGKKSESRAPGWLVRILRHEEIVLLIVLIAVILFFWITVPATRQSRVYFDVLRQMSPNIIAALGFAALMIGGEFDLSIGSMLAVAGVVTVSVFNLTNSMWLGIAAGLLTGPLVGSINGYMVTKQKMTSLMTTLGMLFALRGAVYVYTDKIPVVDKNYFEPFITFYHGSVGPVPIPLILASALVILFYIVLTQTEFGRQIYAMGGNLTAARVSGIKVDRMKMVLFIVCSTTAAIAGLLIAAQTGTGYFEAGLGFEFIIITAVVLGGVSLAGGEGSVLGVVLGVLILGIVGKGLRLAQVYITWQLIISGVVLMVAVYFHGLRKRLITKM